MNMSAKGVGPLSAKKVKFLEAWNMFGIKKNFIFVYIKNKTYSFAHMLAKA